MAQPFVVSAKITGDSSGLRAATRQAQQDVEGLRRTIVQRASGANLVGQIDAMFAQTGRSAMDAGRDIAAYGKKLDDLRAKYNPLFAAERQHETNLAEIRQAYRVGALSVDELVSAVNREKAAHAVAVAALQQHTAAANQNTQAIARGNMQRMNLIFQLNDIVVSLASGMNPAMVFMQQGSQISTIWGPGEGGVGRALAETGNIAKGLFAKFWPLLVVIGAATAAIAGMRHEIEKATGVSVSFGDVALASVQVLTGYLYNWLRPAIEAISDWFSWAWGLVVEQTKAAINRLIGGVHLFIEQIRMMWEIVPKMFEWAGKAAAAKFVESIEQMVNDTLAKVDTLAAGINQIFGTKFQSTTKLNLRGFIPNPDDALAEMARIYKSYEQTAGSILTRDYAGEFFSDVQVQAIKNYNDRLDDTGKKARGAASGLELFKDGVNRLKETIDFGRDTFRSFITDIRQGLAQGMSGWDAFASAAASALDKIADRALSMAADGIFDLILGAFMPGFGQTGGAWRGGLWGSAIFNAKGNVYDSPSLSAHRNTIVDRPTMFAFAKGAGIMGEAGPEAIVPLTRTASGDLGVRMIMGAAGGTMSPTINNYYNIDARGSTMTEARFAAILDARDRANAARVPELMYDARRRGNPMAA